MVVTQEEVVIIVHVTFTDLLDEVLEVRLTNELLRVSLRAILSIGLAHDDGSISH